MGLLRLLAAVLVAWLGIAQPADAVAQPATAAAAYAYTYDGPTPAVARSDVLVDRGAPSVVGDIHRDRADDRSSGAVEAPSEGWDTTNYYAYGERAKLSHVASATRHPTDVQQRTSAEVVATSPSFGSAAVAAESAGGVRFVANSAGDVVPYVRSGTLEVTDHAALALSQRNVGIHALDDLVSSSEGFPYWHDGLWKTGYYDPATRLFAGTAEGRVTTVIQGSRVNANYINNLQAARP